MIVLCVLRSGGDFRVEHVARLAGQIRQYAPAGTRFFCLTDQAQEVAAVGVDAGSLSEPWPGWFAKMCMFQIHGPALYLDLDVTITGDLGPLTKAARRHEFVACCDFWQADSHRLNSSVMAWRGDVSRLFTMFATSPNAHILTYNTPSKWGDQGFVRDHWDGSLEFWQHLLPGKVASFKRGALMGEHLGDCRVLVSHGQPRPWARGGADGWLRRAA